MRVIRGFVPRCALRFFPYSARNHVSTPRLDAAPLLADRPLAGLAVGGLPKLSRWKSELSLQKGREEKTRGAARTKKKLALLSYRIGRASICAGRPRAVRGTSQSSLYT